MAAWEALAHPEIYSAEIQRKAAKTVLRTPEPGGDPITAEFKEKAAKMVLESSSRSCA
jgi:hypothetical protein